MSKKKTEKDNKNEENKEEKKELTGIEKLSNLINKEFGKNSIYCPSNVSMVQKVPRISTGNIALDVDLGGGFATGRIHLITGAFSSGKTYLVLKVAASYQRLGMKVAFIDSEFTFDIPWAEACGLNMDKVYLIRKQEQEQVFDILELLVASGEFGIIIIDSLAALVPKKLHDAAAGKGDMGNGAYNNNAMFRKVLMRQSQLSRENKMVPDLYIINQWREKVGIMFGNPATLPGGKGQYFYASTWIDFSAKETILDAKDRVVGMIFNYITFKNKTASPKRSGLVSMYNSPYKGMSKGDWDSISAVMDLACSSGVIQKGGTWYSSKLFTGSFQFTKLWNYLYNNPDVESKIVDAIGQVMPDIQFNYIPAIRRGAIDDTEVDAGKDGGENSETEKSDAGESDSPEI